MLKIKLSVGVDNPLNTRRKILSLHPMNGTIYYLSIFIYLHYHIKQIDYTSIFIVNTF